MEHIWGLLGPEFLPNSRRTRTLGLGASVRTFNDLAVPGLGGVWYGKQLLLATIGVAVAEEARNQGAKVQNIEVANAIEALACCSAFNNNGWNRDARLRGRTKLQGKDDFSFRRMRQRNFYVTQPMRMATVQALSSLGFVESVGTRFNAFRCSEEGNSFIKKALYEGINHLTNWVLGENDKLKLKTLKALSPIYPFPKEAIPFLRERLIQGGENESREDKERRSNALAWIEELRTKKPGNLTWKHRPKEISAEHWHDLHAGYLFFQTRKAAIAVLDVAEMYIRNTTEKSYSLKRQIPKPMAEAIKNLKKDATKYLAFKHADEESNKFCYECVHDEPSRILQSLVKRDGQVLRLVGDDVKLNSVFLSSPPDRYLETPQARDIPLPEGISYRVRNLYLLNLDMHGELDGWLQDLSGGKHESQ